ncbi:MAG TPA: ATP-binding protein, partial [Anaerolineae bacterium]|nr:ATP-binding protein [Anaerolineae bacterium]
LVYGLRPPVLEQLGLVGSLQALTANFRDGLRIGLDAPPSLPPLPAAVEVAIYRITQEALANVARHAHARQCEVKLRLLDQQFLLEISDNGCGLSLSHQAGVGLNSMRERAAELGGTFHLESSPNGGVRLIVKLPLRRLTVLESDQAGQAT